MILDVIVEDKKRRLKEHKKKIAPEEMRALAEKPDHKIISFRDALGKEGLSIIGEFKKASPSLGKIAMNMDLTDRIDEYNASADAISCLTEEDHFQGSVSYFRRIRDISTLPMIRKDFIIDPYQIYEARAIGADAILLIAAILEDGEMMEYYRLAKDLGMDVLVETHDEKELMRALALSPEIIGVNNRNLKDFSISLETTRRLRPLVPRECLFVSESGVTEDDHIRFLKQCHVDALLIGGAFMFSPEPGKLAGRWKEIYDRN